MTPSRRTFSASTPPESAPDRLSILVVEDDAGARGALRMLLELRGYAVTEAAEGAGAAAHALAQRPAVVLIDIGLPGLDGHGVARRIREGLAGSPMFLIALTGYHDLEERPGNSDFDALMVKPLKVDHLFEFLERVAGEAPRPA